MSELCGKKIGILGGSFDPIHNGHLAIAKAAYEDYQLDEVWFIPAGHSPNKEESEMTAPDVRAEMVALAIRPYPFFKLSMIEILSEETSYTYLTLTKLCEQYPDAVFYFIMGADSLDYFEQWRRPEIICQKVVILVAVREHWDLENVSKKIRKLQQTFQAQIYPLSCKRFDAASRDIRLRLQNGTASIGELPDAVLAFIRENHLYENEIR